jgi:hypothetical protein
VAGVPMVDDGVAAAEFWRVGGAEIAEVET